MTEPLDLMAALVLEDGRRWGRAATDVQHADAAAILEETAPTRFHFVTRGRGYSKTTDLAGVALAVLLEQAPAGSKSYALAADQAQARLLLDSIEGFVRRSPALEAAVTVEACRVALPPEARPTRGTPARRRAHPYGIGWGDGTPAAFAAERLRRPGDGRGRVARLSARGRARSRCRRNRSGRARPR